MTVIRILKTLFFMVVLLLLVLIGVHNRGKVDFQLPPLLSQEVRQPAAVMYFGFFAVGVITGTLASFGRSKPPAGKTDKPS